MSEASKPLDSVARFIGSGAYTGYAPVASGTFGTLPGMALALPFASLAASSVAAYVVALVLAIAVAIWASERCVVLFESKDPSRVTADEVVGFLVTVAFMPLGWKTMVVAFFAFRFFDIAKLSPAREAEGLPGGFGVVTDDLVAGVYANLTVRALAWTGIFELGT